MVNIYVLELTNNKFYVGKTNNPQFRLEQHFNNNGSAWTQKYKPVRVLEIIPNCDDFDEDKYTLKYMSIYGVNNVRGGSFCSIKLDKSNTDTIQKMLDGSTNKCYICGIAGHFARNCPNKEDDWSFIDVFSSVLSFVGNLAQTLNKPSKCSRCNRNGHTEDSCYAKTDKNGEELIDYVEVFSCEYCGKEFDSYKGAQFHENVHCKMKLSKQNSNNCFRCGRKGHISNNCYANMHINGKYLN